VATSDMKETESKQTVKHNDQNFFVSESCNEG